MAGRDSARRAQGHSSPFCAAVYLLHVSTGGEKKKRSILHFSEEDNAEPSAADGPGRTGFGSPWTHRFLGQGCPQWLCLVTSTAAAMLWQRQWH